MTVERLAVTLILCAAMGLGQMTANADEPVAVAVPVSELNPEVVGEVAADKAPGEFESGMPEVDAPALEGAAAEEAAAHSEEEYLPLDLPLSHGDEEPVTPEKPDSNEAPPMETAVLGLEDSPPGQTYFVQAEILGVPNGKGIVSASLCKRKNFTKSGCRTLRVPARQGQVSITFGGVAAGAYAVQVHHDENGNGKMDFTFFGMPKEPYGFSRDAKPVLAPPKFEKASFEVTDGDVSLVINLQNT